MKRCPGLRLFGHPVAGPDGTEGPDGQGPELGSSADSVLARSSAVGRSTDQPRCSAACAATCIDSSTPPALASSTTCERREASTAEPAPSPDARGSLPWTAMACSCNDTNQSESEPELT